MNKKEEEKIKKEIIKTLKTKGECAAINVPVYGHLCAGLVKEVSTKLSVTEQNVWSVMRQMLIWETIKGNWGAYVWLREHEYPKVKFLGDE